eukprot:6965549-Alexandrium_andersonii.AAC.1
MSVDRPRPAEGRAPPTPKPPPVREARAAHATAMRVGAEGPPMPKASKHGRQMESLAPVMGARAALL